MSERDDEALGVRVREALDAVRVEPDVGFERRMREGADAVRSARRARRAAGLALVAAGAAGALIWMFDRPQKRLELVKPQQPVTTPMPAGAGAPTAAEVRRAVSEAVDEDATMVGADWLNATHSIAD